MVTAEDLLCSVFYWLFALNEYEWEYNPTQTPCVFFFIPSLWKVWTFQTALNKHISREGKCEPCRQTSAPRFEQWASLPENLAAFCADIVSPMFLSHKPTCFFFFLLFFLESMIHFFQFSRWAVTFCSQTINDECFKFRFLLRYNEDERLLGSTRPLFWKYFSFRMSCVQVIWGKELALTHCTGSGPSDCLCKTLPNFKELN